METNVKRVVFMDTWIECRPLGGPGIRAWLRDFWREIFPPPARGTYEFQNYALGYKWTATEREMELLQSNGMLGHKALKLHDNYPPLTFADLLGPEFIPEVNPSQAELLRIEARVREAALAWTLFLENLDPDE